MGSYIIPKWIQDRVYFDRAPVACMKLNIMRDNQKAINGLMII